jgi:tRNA (guanine-N7-)-methyltransferase
MAQKKLERFNAIKTFSNVLEYPIGMQGAWSKFFKNNNPLILELACGRGEYAVGLGNLHKNINFIGVDVKGNRIYIGAKKALDQQLNNVAFLRTQIERIPEFFAGDEVDEIWITFPDPQLRTSRAKKRLTHPRFLRLYQQFLKPNGAIHLKTDSPKLYQFTKRVAQLYNLQIIEDIDDVHNQKVISEELKLKTHYESLDIAQSNRIHYLKFTLPKELPDQDEDLQQILKNEELN